MSIPAGSVEIGRLWLRPFTIWLVIPVMLALMNAFGVTTALGSAGALGFWSGLVGVNMIGWLAWRRWMRSDTTARRQFIMGAVLLNGLLALEVPLFYHMLGRTGATIGWRPFVYGMLVTLFVAYLRQTVRMNRSSPMENDRQFTRDPVTPVPMATPGILARAGIADPTDLVSIRAEDHYCRVSVQNGASMLVHYRFKDAVRDLAYLDGAQVHRGAWVADHAVAGGQRDGRRWSLLLTDGTSVSVSETSVALCRARGWLRPVDGLT